MRSERRIQPPRFPQFSCGDVPAPQNLLHLDLLSHMRGLQHKSEVPSLESVLDSAIHF